MPERGAFCPSGCGRTQLGPKAHAGTALATGSAPMPSKMPKPTLLRERARRSLQRRRLGGVGLGVVCAGLYIAREPMLAWCGPAESCQMRLGVTIGVAFTITLVAAAYFLLTTPVVPPRERK